jgi:hypothetical protein
MVLHVLHNVLFCTELQRDIQNQPNWFLIGIQNCKGGELQQNALATLQVVRVN